MRETPVRANNRLHAFVRSVLRALLRANALNDVAKKWLHELALLLGASPFLHRQVPCIRGARRRYSQPSMSFLVLRPNSTLNILVSVSGFVMSSKGGGWFWAVTDLKNYKMS